MDYHDPVMATIAIEDLTGTELGGRKVEIKEAFTKKEIEDREAHRRRLERRLEAERRVALGIVEGDGGARESDGSGRTDRDEGGFVSEEAVVPAGAEQGVGAAVVA